MTRPISAHINLAAFRHNYRLAKTLQGGKALAVIKANAYGHGAVHCANAIAAEADGFAVATLEEAVQLRMAGIKNPILLLEGFFDATELPLINQYDCWIVIHSAWQVKLLCDARLHKPLQIWLKMNSGMHRLGFAPQDFLGVYQQLSQHKNTEKVVVMSHFANADDVNSADTVSQIATFSSALNGLSTIEVSLANSAAILAWQAAQQRLYDAQLANKNQQWSRPGIMLYGANPLIQYQQALVALNNEASADGLRPVMTLQSKVIATQSLKVGESIGYGSLYTAERPTIVGVVACGYADGYPRSAINAPVTVDGHATTLIGRVSMDMLFVDLTHLPSAKVGASVELWGEKVLANAVAKTANTIAYELFCNVKRAQFNYVDANI